VPLQFFSIRRSGERWIEYVSFEKYIKTVITKTESYKIVIEWGNEHATNA